MAKKTTSTNYYAYKQFKGLKSDTKTQSTKNDEKKNKLSNIKAPTAKWFMTNWNHSDKNTVEQN